MPLEQLLGWCYVIAWSISVYPSVWNNWKLKSTQAVSVDFVMLNTFGYSCLIWSLLLQLYCWQDTVAKEDGAQALARPKVSHFDFWYCLHGVVMNLVLCSQVMCGATIWRFHAEQRRMKPVYRKTLLAAITLWLLATLRFFNSIKSNGWDNAVTLAYCNKLILLKILMSLIKYIPQVKHNYERKSMRGFPIEAVLCDLIGGICSIWQLALQLSADQGFTAAIFIANFGKIGIALVTLFFNFVYISQWIVYRA